LGPRAFGAQRGALASLLSALALAAVVGLTPAALAENKTHSDALFEEGRALLQQGKVEAACAKFADSMKIDPSVGALVNLGHCHEVQGKSATAWNEYQRAVALADAEGQADRAKAARDLGAKIEPKLSRLTVRALSWMDGMTVSRDGTPLGPDSIGVPVAVDPGEHVIEASAKGFRSWSIKVVVGGNADRKIAEVPALEPAPEGEPKSGPVGPVQTAKAEPQPGAPKGIKAGAPAAGAPAQPDEGGGFWSGQRIAGLATGVVGIGGIVVGAVFGSKATSQWDEAKTYCRDGDLSRCSADAQSLQQDAKTSATVSTIGLVVGGAALVAGVVVFLTAPSDDAASVAPADSALALRLGSKPALGEADFALVGRF